MTGLLGLLRWSVIAGVLGLGAACVGETDMQPDAAMVAQMTPQAARAALQAIEVRNGTRRGAGLWMQGMQAPGDGHRILFGRDWLALDIDRIVVAPHELLLQASRYNARETPGHFNFALAKLDPALSVTTDQANGHSHWYLFLQGRDGPALITLPLDYDTAENVAAARRVLAALAVLKRAAAADDAAFAHTLAVYRAALPRPVPGEDLRRLALQAKGAVRDKDFYAGEEFYAQGLEIAPWWPEGRYNRALLFAAIGDYADAVVDMQRFLALVPETPNARAVQDEIYNWQRKAQAQ